MSVTCFGPVTTRVHPCLHGRLLSAAIHRPKKSYACAEMLPRVQVVQPPEVPLVSVQISCPMPCACAAGVKIRLELQCPCCAGTFRIAPSTETYPDPDEADTPPYSVTANTHAHQHMVHAPDAPNLMATCISGWASQPAAQASEPWMPETPPEGVAGHITPEEAVPVSLSSASAAPEVSAGVSTDFSPLPPPSVFEDTMLVPGTVSPCRLRIQVTPKAPTRSRVSSAPYTKKARTTDGTD